MGCTVIFHTGAIASSDHYLTFAAAGLPYLGSVSYGVISIPYNT